ncbi:MAG: hypothetical protein GXX91_11405 [Verrucomicrobiaceae bacterium]|nr:hypothetical protein [Verrucomicrobiaceae bacterium]
MSITSIADIPEDLAAEAAQVEGLQERLILWLRAEVTQDKKRKSRHSSQAREIVHQAMDRAEGMKAAGFDREEAMARFQKNYDSIIEQISRP